MEKTLADWVAQAVAILESGLADKLSKENVTAYRVKNIVRVDIKLDS